MTDQSFEEPQKIGRPSSFTPDVGTAICERMAEGQGLREICLDPDMPDRRTVLRWLEAQTEFRRQYARARESLMDFYQEEILKIAFDGSKDVYVDEQGRTRTDHEVVNRSRLKVDTLKWIMSKLAPRKYGTLVELGAAARPSHEEMLDELEDNKLKVSWQEPQRIERIILEGVPGASDGYVDELKKRIEDLEIELGRREAPPKLLTYNPGPLPASIDPLLLKSVVDLIRDCVPEADTRPGDDVLREVLTVAGEALRAHYAAQSVHDVCTHDETEENAA